MLIEAFPFVEQAGRASSAPLRAQERLRPRLGRWRQTTDLQRPRQAHQGQGQEGQEGQEGSVRSHR